MLQKALQKFTLCPNGLTVHDLKILVSAATCEPDSPIRKKKNEARIALSRAKICQSASNVE
jgi:hypothetical protein